MKIKAKKFATKAHEGQTRKNSTVPYITHPIRVAERLERAGFDEALVCAGYLHDVVEDTPYTSEYIRRQFGSHIAGLVAAHTEDKSKTWKERKQHTIDTVKDANKDIKALIVADKLDNLLSLENSLQEEGATIWKQFNAGYNDQKWYHTAIAQNMNVGLHEDDTPDFFHEFDETVKNVFSETK
ncbi:HD domain-containing protein [Oceanobacillus halotolerans]|uniref:HD domain-containing protein n=1 Tax=Oceanobacillus halotolerans TaxID=2663380 RepID=UPI0013D9A5A6|nr:HD domain-containing protein [Oceanobacillus halotolerans]